VTHLPDGRLQLRSFEHAILGDMDHSPGMNFGISHADLENALRGMMQERRDRFVQALAEERG